MPKGKPGDNKPYVLKFQRKVHRLKLAIMDEFYKDGCLVCDEKDPVVLQPHHVGKKRMNVAAIIGANYGVAKLRSELALCVPLCANCHKRVHAGTVVLPDPTMLQALYYSTVGDGF